MTEKLKNSDKLSLLSEAVEITSLTNKERINLLGAIGLYDASLDLEEYVNPPEPLNVFRSINWDERAS